jgi:hypothetical protein
VIRAGAVQRRDSTANSRAIAAAAILARVWQPWPAWARRLGACTGRGAGARFIRLRRRRRVPRRHLINAKWASTLRGHPQGRGCARALLITAGWATRFRRAAAICSRVACVLMRRVRWCGAGRIPTKAAPGKGGVRIHFSGAIKVRGDDSAAWR